MGNAARSALREGKLAILTLYDRPTDVPTCAVVRMHVVENRGVSGPTTAVWTFDTVKAARAALRETGLVLSPRASTDDPKIVESWL